MSESESVSMGDNMESVWDYIKDNPRIVGLPLSKKKGLDLLNAMRDVYVAYQISTEAGNSVLTMLANVIVASVQGDGEAVVEEVLVQEAMMDFDEQAKDILNEKP